LSAELFSVHMVQHLILLMAAPPLLILGSPLLVTLWALPENWRVNATHFFRRFDDWHIPLYMLWQPLLVWALYAFTMWIWHLPSLYEAALNNRWIHDLQHGAFLLSACLFWRVLLDPFDRRRMGRGVGILFLFTTSLHGGALGALLTLSPRPWYGAYAEHAERWNLTALEDQQLAGAIMWMPACLIYIGITAVMFALWLREYDQRRERVS
jgi:putative membrane protein